MANARKPPISVLDVARRPIGIALRHLTAFLAVFSRHVSREGVLMLDTPQSSDTIVSKVSSMSVVETVDRLTRVIADRGFTPFRVIDHNGMAERVGVQMPESKLVMFGKPTVGAAVMLAAPLAALDLPLKVLVWEDGNGAVSVSYNSPEFLADRLQIDGTVRAPFDAVASIVEATLNAAP
jgi:uncharacterized protein (DUF302 family)